MATQKTVKIQNNKALTVRASKNGFKTITKSVIISQDQTYNINMIPENDAQDIFAIGDRFLGISSYFGDFVPSGSYDTTSLYQVVAKQTTGNSLQDVAVSKEQWLSYVENTLSIETAQGTSSSFVFTYNGSTWDLTQATTISGITATELQDNFGITFSGTPTNGNVITVKESYYNKFACFALDASYRSSQLWSSQPGYSAYPIIMPITYETSDWQNSHESATFFNEWLQTNKGTRDYPIFTYLANFGQYLSFDKLISPVLPTVAELTMLCNCAATIDASDPTLQDGSSTNALIGWWRPSSGDGSGAWSCLEVTDSNQDALYVVYSEGSPSGWVRDSGKNEERCCIPIFEVPVM